MRIEENLIRYAVKAWNGARPVPTDVTIEVNEFGIAVEDDKAHGEDGTLYQSYCPTCDCFFTELVVPKQYPRPTCNLCGNPLVRAWYATVFKEYLDKSYDLALSSGCQKLTWLPWVGSQFAGHQIFVAGESHYINKETYFFGQPAIEDWLDDPWATRETHAEYPILGPDDAGWKNNAGRGGNSFHDNLLKILVGDSLVRTRDDIVRRMKFWNSLAFANLVQRPLVKVSGVSEEKPQVPDRRDGWEAMIHVIEILKPRLCIFAGVFAAGAFAEPKTIRLLNAQNVKFDLESGPAIDGCYLRFGTLDIRGFKVPMVFIQHPSRCSSTWSSWRALLLDRVPWLKAEIDSILA